MARSKKPKIREEFGTYLKNHREKVIKEPNLLKFSYSSNLDNSKLGKIEKGEIDIRFSTLLEIAKTYKLTEKSILGFNFTIEE